MPQNPRSLYERLMHINEQTSNSLRDTLNKYFEKCYVWSGDIKGESFLVNNVIQEIDYDITALAGNEVATKKLLLNAFSYPLEAENLFVDIRIKSYIKNVVQSRNIKFLVEVINKSPYIMKSLMPHPVRISYHIFDIKGRMVLFEGNRTELPCILYPNKRVDVEMEISTSCLNKGKYVILVTLVQELCFWFNDINSENQKSIGIEII